MNETRQRSIPRAVQAFALGITLLGPGLARAEVVFDRELPTPALAGGISDSNYRIGPQDELNLVVLDDKDLSQTLVVDDSGHIVLPLVGPIVAAGKTPEGLAVEIAAKLREKYLQNPQVGITVSKAISQKIVVEGEVSKPGVYQITGVTTLIQAIALAGGADQYANFKRVAVFRYVDNTRHAALFNLNDVNEGRAGDPLIYKNDIIVVERSGVKASFRDFVTPLAPIIYLIPQVALNR